MIKIFPGKKNLHTSDKVLAVVVALTLSIFHSPNTTAANSLILDNNEPGTSSTGKWRSWKGDSPYGKYSRYTSSRGATYIYNLDLPAPGEYQVFAWWDKSTKHSTSVPYDITHPGGTRTVRVNQQENGGQWNPLGTWMFDKTATITIRSLGSGSTSADAIMLLPAEINTIPESEAPVESSAPVMNSAPVISGTPINTVTANESYSFRANASDADDDQLTFSISNKPAWASFSTRRGLLRGTPTDSHVNTYSGIVISVTDGTDTVSLPGFSIQVAAAPGANTTPVISGAPAVSVTANEAYSFRPSASDADDDQLTFSISNKPAWARFSTSSGLLRGTPTDSHMNTYSGIVISVTDGTDTASLGTFSIIVSGTETQTGSVTLNWTAPVARTDGSPISMSEIAGFTVHYGTSTGSYPNSLSVDDGSATSATIADLQAGTYYLTVTTRDSEGRESGNSDEVAKAVNY